MRTTVIAAVAASAAAHFAVAAPSSAPPSLMPSSIPASMAPPSMPASRPSSAPSSPPSAIPSMPPSSVPSSIPSSIPSPSSLPIVDLGYELHQAFSYNSTGDYYNFSNIRFAQAPVGELRWTPPLPPTGRNTTINNGSVGRMCPQASPKWELTTAAFLPDYLTGKPFNSSQDPALKATGFPPQDPRTTEDCLFLDIVVPKKIFASANATNQGASQSVTQIMDGQIQVSTTSNNASSNGSNSTGAPVLVWIYGGGYTSGDKADNDPSGLIKSAQDNGTSEGLIFVAINYRLGAFGFLPGPDLQANGTANVGLYDQRLALKWVQDNIHLFGGDPNQVTVIGESAGGGSIMHQITAYGGLNGAAPFQQAILQSPAFQNIVSYFQEEQILNMYLKLINVTTVEAARQLPYSVLQMANVLQVGMSVYGQFGFGPVVDGLFAPAIPGKLLLQGSYDKNVNIMVGHNSDEGLVFTSPNLTNSTTLVGYIEQAFPTISQPALDYLNNTLYPVNMTGQLGTTGYDDEIGRADLLISESTFTCNTYYLDRAFGNKSYAYQFSVFPGIHGQDIAYTFFTGRPSAKVSSPSAAYALQDYITSFAMTGSPNGNMSLPYFSMYGANSSVIDLNATSISDITDPVANYRCLWWQKELYA